MNPNAKQIIINALCRLIGCQIRKLIIHSESSDYSEKQDEADTLENSYCYSKKELAADLLQFLILDSVGSSAFEKVKFFPCPIWALVKFFRNADRRGFA